VTLAFAVGALVLSVVLALSTYLTARHYLIEQRQRTAMRQAYSDASYIREGLLPAGAEVSDALGSISPPANSVLLVRRGGQWYSSSLDLSAHDIPASLLSAVAADGGAAFTWTHAAGGPAIVVGLALPEVDAEYYEIAVTAELDNTLTTLRLALLACAAATTVAGALLGRVAAGRLLSPLNSLTGAAARISAGNVDTRVAATEDPDLATLVGAFNDMLDALDERVQRERRFVADVSHELKSPLTTLLTSMSVLRADSVAGGASAESAPTTGAVEAMSPRARAAVELIGRELDRFQHSLEDLLVLGRLDSGAAETNVSVVDARDLVRESLEVSGRSSRALLAPAPAAAGPLPVLVDKQQIRRALINLFDNADVHGGGLVEVSVARNGDVVDVAVHDDGPGVAPEDRTRIFERFARAGSRASHPGSGLGLSIVLETMLRHEGSVWCSAGISSGSTFTARLPLLPDGDRRDDPESM
jgi:signal transduction histidine kinase